MEFDYDHDPFSVLSISKDHLYMYKVIFGINEKVKGRKESLVKTMRSEELVYMLQGGGSRERG